MRSASEGPTTTTISRLIARMTGTYANLNSNHKLNNLNLFVRAIVTYYEDIKASPITIHVVDSFKASEGFIRDNYIEINEESIMEFDQRKSFHDHERGIIYTENTIFLKAIQLKRLFEGTEKETLYTFILLKLLGIKNNKILSKEDVVKHIEQNEYDQLMHQTQTSFENHLEKIYDFISEKKDQIEGYKTRIRNLKDAITQEQRKATELSHRLLRSETPKNIFLEFIKYLTKIDHEGAFFINTDNDGGVGYEINLDNVFIKNIDKSYLERAQSELYKDQLFNRFLPGIITGDLKIYIGNFKINIFIPFDENTELNIEWATKDEYHNPHLEIGCSGTYDEVMDEAREDRDPIVLFNIITEMIHSINFTDSGSHKLPEMCALINQKGDSVFERNHWKEEDEDEEDSEWVGF